MEENGINLIKSDWTEEDKDDECFVPPAVKHYVPLSELREKYAPIEKESIWDKSYRDENGVLQLSENFKN